MDEPGIVLLIAHLDLVGKVGDEVGLVKLWVQRGEPVWQVLRRPLRRIVECSKQLLEAEMLERAFWDVQWNVGMFDGSSQIDSPLSLDSPPRT